MLVLSNVVWVLDFTNASVNFFIFMGMSTNFNKTFHEIFSQNKTQRRWMTYVKGVWIEKQKNDD